MSRMRSQDRFITRDPFQRRFWNSHLYNMPHQQTDLILNLSRPLDSLDKKMTFLVCVLFALYVSTNGKTLIVRGKADDLSPVVFVPGHGGNQMEIKVDMERPLLDHCQTHTDWIRSWLNLWQFLPGNIDCWAEYNKLEFDPSTRSYYNVKGVTTRIPGWGRTDTIEFLDPSLTAWVLGNLGSYGAPLIREMKKWGYSTHNLRGAPYDFRYGSLSIPAKFYNNLRELVEEAYRDNSDKKVVLMAHSMGGLFAHRFLGLQTPEWKKKYIQSMVTLSTPWKGALTMANAVISGYSWGHNGLNTLALRKVQRHSESGVFLMPSPSEWKSNEVIVSTPKRNYTSADYDQLFDDMGYPMAKKKWAAIKDVTNHLEHPGVDVFCLYSTGIPTPDRLVYGVGEFPDSQPYKKMGDGDGTVNARSARACRYMWKDTEDTIVFGKDFANLTHNGILHSKEVHSYLKDVLSSNID